MKLIKNIFKTGLDVLTLPIDGVRDIVDVVTDDNEDSHLAKRINEIKKDVSEIADDLNI